MRRKILFSRLNVVVSLVNPVNILSEPPRREKLPHVNNLEDVVGLIKNSKKIVVLTGAGIGVSSGILDANVDRFAGTERNESSWIPTARTTTR